MNKYDVHESHENQIYNEDISYLNRKRKLESQTKSNKKILHQISNKLHDEEKTFLEFQECCALLEALESQELPTVKEEPLVGNTTDENLKCNVLSETHDPQELSPVKEEPDLEYFPVLLSSNKVFFDLETTSLAWNCSITQIAAAHGNETFNNYVIPKQPISFDASRVTGLTYDSGILALHGKPVDGNTCQSALQDFLEWLKLRSPVLLFAHNAKFDSRVFFYAISSCNLVESFQKHIIGFVDTLPLFKRKYPNLRNHRQGTLVREFLKKSYGEHNAQDDALTLQELYNKTQPHDMKSYCTFASAFGKWQYDTDGRFNYSSFRIMIKNKCVSKEMASKMAKSGVNVAELHSVHKKYGCKGVKEILAQKNKLGKPRVTKKKIIERILSFLCK